MYIKGALTKSVCWLVKYIGMINNEQNLANLDEDHSDLLLLLQNFNTFLIKLFKNTI